MFLCDEASEVSSPLLTEMFDMKTRYDESDHVLVRATRSVTDKLQDLFGKRTIS